MYKKSFTDTLLLLPSYMYFHITIDVFKLGNAISFCRRLRHMDQVLLLAYRNSMYHYLIVSKRLLSRQWWWAEEVHNLFLFLCHGCACKNTHAGCHSTDLDQGRTVLCQKIDFSFGHSHEGVQWAPWTNTTQTLFTRHFKLYHIKNSVSCLLSHHKWTAPESAWQWTETYFSGNLSPVVWSAKELHWQPSYQCFQ